MTTTETVQGERLVHVGQNVPKMDGFDIVSGQLVYGYDFSLAHMLHAGVRRSEVPHARLISIDVADALKIPGVRAIITASDIPDLLYGIGLRDTPVLARDLVRYIGEPIAAVAAESEKAAAEAVSEIHVKYEELPAIFSIADALRESPHFILHPRLMDYETSPRFPPNRDPKRPNVSNYVQVRRGDVEAAFREAKRIIENSFTTSMVHHWHTEPIASVAKFDSDGTVTVWTATQSAYRIRHQLAQGLGLDPSGIRVIVTGMGGGFGNKLNVFTEAIAAHLSRITKRPVRLRLTRDESVVATTVRHPFQIHIKDGVDSSGKIIARKIDAVLNGGAYAGSSGMAVARNAVFASASTYKIPNLWVDSARVYTNQVPGGAFRGFGTAQMAWAVESQMDIVARELRQDPIEFRKSHLLGEDEESGLGEIIQGVDYLACLNQASELIQWAQKETLPSPWKRGKGIAIGEKYTAEPGAAASVRYREDETLEVWVSAAEMGQGIRTTVTQIAAEAFQVPIERVRVVQTDTNITPYDSGGLSSRQLFNLGNAILLASNDLKQQIFKKASALLGTPLEELTIADGVIRSRVNSSKRLRVGDLFLRGRTRYGAFHESGSDFWGHGTFFIPTGELDPKTGQATLPRINAAYASIAEAAEVDVNTETGQVVVRRLVAVADVGKAVNPKLVECQIEGAMSMGLSAALFEELIAESGHIVNPDLKDYRAMLSTDVTDLRVHLIENPHIDGPFGAKPVGELGIVVVAPAIANAIHDATGIRVTDLPITSERMMGLIKKRAE